MKKLLLTIILGICMPTMAADLNIGANIGKHSFTNQINLDLPKTVDKNRFIRLSLHVHWYGAEWRLGQLNNAATDSIVGLGYGMKHSLSGNTTLKSSLSAMYHLSPYNTEQRLKADLDMQLVRHCKSGLNITLGLNYLYSNEFVYNKRVLVPIFDFEGKLLTMVGFGFRF